MRRRFCGCSPRAPVGSDWARWPPHSAWRRAPPTAFCAPSRASASSNRTGPPEDAQLGAALLHLGTSYLDINELRSRSLNWADALAARSGEAVRIGVPLEGKVLIVHHVFRPDDTFQTLDVGSLLPLHASALGKVLLAFGATPVPSHGGRFNVSSYAIAALLPTPLGGTPLSAMPLTVSGSVTGTRWCRRKRSFKDR